MIWSTFFFFHLHSSIQRPLRWTDCRFLSERSSVQVRSATDLFSFCCFTFFCDVTEPSGAWARNLLQLDRRHFEAHLGLCWDWALPPTFFWQYTTPLFIYLFIYWYNLWGLSNTVKLQIFVRYPFSYFWLETGSYELIFVLSRASKQNYIEIRWLQDKNIFSSSIKFRTFFKSTKVRN